MTVASARDTGVRTARVSPPRTVRPCCASRARAPTGAAAQPHLEFRAADSSANPWLALAALVRAGLAGVTGEGPVPDVPAAGLSL
jgi:glutamine synthetase